MCIFEAHLQYSAHMRLGKRQKSPAQEIGQDLNLTSTKYSQRYLTNARIDRVLQKFILIYADLA